MTVADLRMNFEQDPQGPPLKGMILLHCRPPEGVPLAESVALNETPRTPAHGPNSNLQGQSGTPRGSLQSVTPGRWLGPVECVDG
ncbi:hypothetical protein NHX12_027459, partial [Muraenolepis orangiensis]